MTSNVQFTREDSSGIPVASASGKSRLFLGLDGTMYLKDSAGTTTPLVGTGQPGYYAPVVAATAEALPAYSRVSNVITASANGALPAIDGVTLTASQAFLLKDGAAGADNGVYEVTQVGTGSSPFILTRRSDMSASSQLVTGGLVPTGPDGTSNQDNVFLLASSGTLTLNTTALIFKAVAGSGFVAGLYRPVRVISDATLPAYARVSNVITASSNGALPDVDGVTLVEADSFLFVNGAAGEDNGIYEVTQVGDGSNPFILTRRSDFSDSTQAIPGSLVASGPEGSVNSSKLFVLSTANPITLNTTSLVFTDLSGTPEIPDGLYRPVTAVTVEALPAYARVLNVITASSNGALPDIDDVTLSVSDSLLLKDGAAGEDNGIYEVTQVGDGSNPFILTRRDDLDTSAKALSGGVVPVGPDGWQHKNKLFRLATSGSITLNTTALSFVEDAPNNYSYAEVDVSLTIPSGQTMLHQEDIEILDGDVILDGDFVDVATFDNFSVLYVPALSARVVQENDELLFTDDMVVDGQLIVDGQMLDVTPLDGDSILSALTAIAPNTPAILGVASPVSFLTPAEARGVMDVPSFDEMDSAITAATRLALRFDGTIKAADFTAEDGYLYLWDGTATITVTMPTTPTANMKIGFLADGGFNGALSLDFNGYSVSPQVFGDPLVIPGGVGQAAAPFVFQFSDYSAVWFTVENGALLNMMVNGANNSIQVKNSAGLLEYVSLDPYTVVSVPGDPADITGLTVDADSVVGRIGSGDVQSIPISSLSRNWALSSHNSAFTADPTVINKFALASFTITLPLVAHNVEVEVKETGAAFGTGPTVTIMPSGGQTIEGLDGAGGGSMTVNKYGIYLKFKYDADVTTWRIVGAAITA